MSPPLKPFPKEGDQAMVSWNSVAWVLDRLSAAAGASEAEFDRFIRAARRCRQARALVRRKRYPQRYPRMAK